MSQFDSDTMTKLEEKFKENGFSLKNGGDEFDNGFSYKFDKPFNNQLISLNFSSHEDRCGCLNNTMCLSFSKEGEKIAEISDGFIDSKTYKMSSYYTFGSSFYITTEYTKSDFVVKIDFSNNFGKDISLTFTNCSGVAYNRIKYDSRMKNVLDYFDLMLCVMDNGIVEECFKLKRTMKKHKPILNFYVSYGEQREKCLFSKKRLENSHNLSKEEISEVIDKLLVKSKKDSRINKCIAALELLLEQYSVGNIFNNEYLSYKNHVAKTLLEICDFVIENSDSLLTFDFDVSLKMKEFFDICGFQLEEKRNPSHSEYVKAYSEMRGKDDPIKKYTRGRRFRG